MKAGVFYKANDLRIEEIEKPVPGRDEVLIRVKACGICGTDVHIFKGDKGCFPTPPGTVLGHEFSGIIEAVGADVTEFGPGDRVTVDPNKLCGECSYCKSGIGHFCERMVGIGTSVNGGFAEYCAVPKSQVYRIADGTTYEMAAMTEPTACCLHGIDLCELSCGDTVAVIGGGMIGMIMLQLSKLSGAGKLILIEPVAEKRALAEKLGADLTIDPFREDVPEVLRRNGIERIAAVIECVGKTATIRQAIEIAGKHSVVMMFGLTAPEDILPIKPFEIFQKEITLRASFINPYTQKRALTLIDAQKIDVSSMVYACEPLERLPEILADDSLRSKGKFIIRL
ncbi:MAG: zinc-dependent alcohol dehydrogenase family protein [Lachnospiraceae bacterium]|nr:zinc-dependent alcohol dehydrogenase family protein [Lachnospiraceae bacterium]